jgi:hypothetical protein
MAEEGTLGLARAQEEGGEELSKEQLQRELDQARDSISNTVTEIRETVANQVQAVKDTLDWREQFRRRPIAWTAGAMGAGFLVGYGMAAAIKGDDHEFEETTDYYAGRTRSYGAQPLAASRTLESQSMAPHHEDEGPGLLDKITNSNAYGRVREEVGELGNSVVKELSNTAKQLVIPALVNSLRNFIGGYLPASTEKSTTNQDASQRASAAYEPRLERT